MQISELAQQASVSVHALRHYERLGLIRPDRRANGYRDYPARMRREVVFIAMSRQLGFSLPQIALRLVALPVAQEAAIKNPESANTLGRSHCIYQALASCACPVGPQTLDPSQCSNTSLEIPTMTAPLTPARRDALSSAPRSTMETLEAVVLAMPMACTLGLRFVHAEPGRVEV